MDSVSLSLEVLGGLLGKTTVELQSALMTDGNDGKKVPVDQSNIDKFVAEAIRTRLAEQKVTGKDEHISYGKKSAYDDVEKYLVENHGVPKGTDWKAGFAHVVTEAKTKAQTSEENIKSSEPYKAIAKKLEESEDTLKSTKKGFREKTITDKFDRIVEEILSDPALALALPEDKAIRDNQLKSFKISLKNRVKLDMDDKEDVFPVDEGGKKMEDSNFVPLTLKTLVSNDAKTFWPAKNGDPGRQAPPAGQHQGEGSGNGDGGTPKTLFPKWKDSQEFSSFIDKSMLDGKDAAFLKEATAAFESQPK